MEEEEEDEKEEEEDEEQEQEQEHEEQSVHACIYCTTIAQAPRVPPFAFPGDSCYH